MRLETSRRQVPTINVSALVDVVFTLLIFLLLAATFSRVGKLDVALPEADSESIAGGEGLIVVVPRQGPVEIEGVEVEDEGLLAALNEQREAHESLLLVADGAVALERAVKVLDTAGRAGFFAISIATRPPDRGAPLEERHGGPGGSGPPGEKSRGEREATGTEAP